MLAFGSYQPQDSCIHHINAQVKIILACAFSICAVICSDWIALGALWLAVIALYCLSRLRLRDALAGVAPLAVLLLFTVLFHIIEPQQDLSDTAAAVQPGSLGFEGCIPLGTSLVLSFDGLFIGLFFAARIALVICACSLLTFTTSQLQVTNALERLLAPLRHLKLPVDDICSVVSIALRFVPTVATCLEQLKRARLARGARFEGSGLVESVKAWCSMIVPLFVTLFRRADLLARAMDARCYGMGKRSSLQCEKASLPEVALCVVGVFAIGAIVVLL